MKKKLILILVVFSVQYGLAQDEQFNFSLEEAISYALENSRAVKNAKKDIEAAEKQKWETTTIGLPQISAKIDYQNWLKQQVSLLPAEFFGGNAGEFAEVTFGTKQNMNATATLNQLLFDGSYLVGLQSAKVFLEISKNAKNKTDLEVRKSVINAYGNVLLSNESVKITQNNKGILENNLAETEKIYENGLTEEENVEQLQITLSQLDNTLKNAIRLRNLSYKMLNITLGIDLEKTVTVTDDLESLAKNHIKLELLNSSDDVSNNIDYKIAENDKRAKELLLKLEKSKALPQLSAFVNGGYTGNNDQFNFFNSDQKWFGSSLLGLSLNVPIFSSFQRSAATQRAKINLEKSKTELTETEQQLKFKIASAKSNYQFAIETYKTTGQNLHLAESIEAKNRIKYSEGISTSFDLRQAQTQLYGSQQEFLQSMLDVITKKTELETLLNEQSN